MTACPICHSRNMTVTPEVVTCNDCGHEAPNETPAPKVERRPYGYTALVSQGGECIECGATYGGHFNGCLKVD